MEDRKRKRNDAEEKKKKKKERAKKRKTVPQPPRPERAAIDNSLAANSQLAVRKRTKKRKGRGGRKHTKEGNRIQHNRQLGTSKEMVMRYTRAGFIRWIKEPRVECVEKRRMLSDELSQPVGRWIWAGDRRESHFARIRCLYVDAATERIVSRFDAAFGNTAADAENLAYRRILRFMLDVPSDASVAEAFEKKMAEHSKQLKKQKKATSNRAIERRLTKEDFLDSCIYERQIDGDARDLRFWVQNKDDPYPLAFSFRTADGGEEKRRLKRIWDDEEGGWSFVGFKETLLALCSGCEELISKTEDAIVAAETRYYDEGSEPRLHLLCFECFEREKRATRPLREVDNVVMAKGSADIKLRRSKRAAIKCGVHGCGVSFMNTEDVASHSIREHSGGRVCRECGGLYKRLKEHQATPRHKRHVQAHMLKRGGNLKDCISASEDEESDAAGGEDNESDGGEDNGDNESDGGSEDNDEDNESDGGGEDNESDGGEDDGDGDIPMEDVDAMQWAKENWMPSKPPVRKLYRGGGNPADAEPINDETDKLIRWYRKQNVTATACDSLLSILTDPSFDVTNLPRSLYMLLKEEQQAYPRLSMYEFTDPKTQQKVYTLDFLEMFSRMMEDPVLGGEFVYDYEPSDVIAHPCNADGWKEYVKYKQRLDERTRKDHRLLMPVIFVDEYEQLRYNKRKVLGVYFSAANLPRDRIETSRNKHLLSLLPPGIDSDYALDQIFVRSGRMLEKGTTLMVDGEEVPVCGSVYMIAGDHLGEAQVSALIGPCGKHPSRYSEASTEQLGTTMFNEGVPMPKKRNALETYAYLCQSLSGSKTNAQVILRALGLRVFIANLFVSINPPISQKKSSLWSLVWFRKHFYQRFGLCRMHLSTEGNWRRHTLYLAAKYGPELWAGINKSVQAATTGYLTLQALPHIIALVNSKIKGKVLDLTTCTAEQLESWVQVSPFCLLGSIKQEDFDCWMEHLVAERRLWSASFAVSSLADLQWDVDRWRYSFKNTLCYDGADRKDADDGGEDNKSDGGGGEDNDSDGSGEDNESDGGGEDNDSDGGGEDNERYGGKDNEIVRTGGKGKERVRFDNGGEGGSGDGSAGNVKKLPFLSSPGNICRYPNFESESHWADQIRLLGPVWFQDTKFWETKHAEGKSLVNRTNRKAICRDVLAMSAQRTVVMLRGGSDERDYRMHRDDLAPLKVAHGVSNWRANNGLRRSLQAVVDAMGRDDDLSGGYRKCDGFYLGGKKVQLGSYLEVSDGRKETLGGVRTGEFDIGQATHRLVRLDAVLLIDKTLWASATVLQFLGDDPDLRCPTFAAMKRLDWFPLSADSEVTIVARVHVLVHPTKKAARNKDVLCLNVWVRRVHTGWPS